MRSAATVKFGKIPKTPIEPVIVFASAKILLHKRYNIRQMQHNFP
jgi:hypothetical protein